MKIIHEDYSSLEIFLEEEKEVQRQPDGLIKFNQSRVAHSVKLSDTQRTVQNGNSWSNIQVQITILSNERTTGERDYFVIILK